MMEMMLEVRNAELAGVLKNLEDCMNVTVIQTALGKKGAP